VSWHALQKVSAMPGERILVIGGGSIGLMAVAAARALGLDVDLAARHDHQREAGERLGAGTPTGEYQVLVEAAGTDSALADCVRRAAPGARIETLGVEADAALLREEHGAFDAVVSTEVIEHLHAPHRLPALAAGLLQPGGWLIVSTPFHGYWKNLALSLAGRWDHHHTALWYGGHVKFWSRRTLSQLLQDNGFEVVGFHGVGRLPWLWKSMVLVARRTSAEVGAGHARGA
jgi:SAM-dependent methyltransferase